MDYSEFTFGLLVCFFLSFILGIERQYRRRSLGLRTMILIAIGSYLFVSFSFMLSGYNIDATRIASQVVAGIGFFGAGVILKDNEKNKVRGLTTAATMWCDAAIGVLCAGRFIKEAIVAALFVLFANIVLRYINHFINDKTKNRAISEIFNVKICSKDISKITEYINNYLSDKKDVEIINFISDEEDIEFDFVVKKNEERKFNDFIIEIISKYKIKKYEYKKLDEYNIDDEEL